jgi:heme exporter protein C
MKWAMLANPQRFMAWSGPAIPVLALIGAALTALGLWLGLFEAPAEADQGEVARILFIHVPAAWLSMLIYTLLVGASVSWFVWRHSLADLAASAAAPFGAAFTFICLATGSIWGRPTWGTWWEWDGRLTSMLVLLLIYLGYIALRQALDQERRIADASAILALIGAVNIPIIKFSVDWWSTLHQPAAVFRFDGPTLPGSVLTPLLLTFAGLLLSFLALWFIAIRTALRAQRITVLENRRWEAERLIAEDA